MSKHTQSKSHVASSEAGQDWISRIQAQFDSFMAGVKSSPDRIRDGARTAKRWFKPNGWCMVAAILALALLGAMNPQGKEVTSISLSNAAKHRR